MVRSLKKRKSNPPDPSDSTKPTKQQQPDLINTAEHDQEPGPSNPTDHSMSIDHQEADGLSRTSESEEPTLLKYINKQRRFPIPCSTVWCQVEMPDVTEVLDLHSYREVTEGSKWLGTRVWPLDGNQQVPDQVTDDNIIGQGRNNNCSCRYAGSLDCVKLHVKDRRAQLRLELGSAFEAWKFDEMGEAVADSWSKRKRNLLKTIVEKSSLPNKSFLSDRNLRRLQKTRKEMISYYFNVLVPQRISAMIRSRDPVDSDDDGYVDRKRTTRNSQRASAAASKFLRPMPAMHRDA